MWPHLRGRILLLMVSHSIFILNAPRSLKQHPRAIPYFWDYLLFFCRLSNPRLLAGASLLGHQKVGKKSGSVRKAKDVLRP